MSRKPETVIGWLIAIPVMTVFGTALVAAISLLNGFVLIRLWAWFVVPRFGLAPLSMSAAVGLSVLASFLANQYVPPKGGDNWNRTAFMFLHPLLCLLIGYITHILGG